MSRKDHVEHFTRSLNICSPIYVYLVTRSEVTIALRCDPCHLVEKGMNEWEKGRNFGSIARVLVGTCPWRVEKET